MINTYYFIILFFLPSILTFDCREICNLTVYVNENTPNNELKWNLIDLLSNRTLTKFPFEHYQYSLSIPSDYFEIESPILKFRSIELDREKICNKIFFHDDECSLQLQIFTQTSFVILFKLIILDINDWKPYFKDDYIHINIRENLPINYRVQLPIAYDHDSSKYNIDHYEFITNENLIKDSFQLEQIHDELRLKLLRKLDCEQTNNYQLEIIAIDKGGLKSNILHVNITVDDLNEFQPRFKQRLYHTRIPENTPISNTSILNLIATDDDCYDKIILYSLLPGDISNDIFPFAINQYTGSLYVIHELDYEKLSTYRFRAKASNLDKVTSSIVPVIIDILDINDNQPLIQMNILNNYKSTNSDEDNEDFIININENLRLGQVIGTVLIRDNDSMMINRKLSLKIVSCWPLRNPCPIELDSGFGTSDENEKNIIGSTNYLIRTSRQLDSENGDDKFTVILEARDYGDPSLISQRRLVIIIHDQNDCIPKFSQTNYQFRLSESTPIGFSIGHIQAIDHDLSPNFHRIEYKLTENEKHHIIEINPLNGSIYLTEKLSPGMTFNISVMAVDQHNHSLYDRTNIQILSYDEETCLPTFIQTLYVFNVTEHRLAPYEIGQVSADSCLSTSIPFSYHLVKDKSSTTTLPFTIDAHNGRITVTSELDREMKAFYKFFVDSFNHKSHQSSQTEIHINILDENDHYPVFDNSINNAREQYIYINKSLSIIRRHEINETQNNIFITRIHATDEDQGSNGLVNYYFTHNDNYAFFHLYSNGSIVLYNQNNLQLPYRLEIYARDQGSPVPLNSKESIVVYICDGLKRNECPSDDNLQQQNWVYTYENNPLKGNRLTTNFYLGSIFIMISVLLFIVIIIFCVVWNLIIKGQLKNKHEQIHNNGLKSPTESYNCRAEARKNLLVSDSLYDSSPTMASIDGNHRLKSVAV